MGSVSHLTHLNIKSKGFLFFRWFKVSTVRTKNRWTDGSLVFLTSKLTQGVKLIEPICQVTATLAKLAATVQPLYYWLNTKRLRVAQKPVKQKLLILPWNNRLVSTYSSTLSAQENSSCASHPLRTGHGRKTTSLRLRSPVYPSARDSDPRWRLMLNSFSRWKNDLCIFNQLLSLE